MRFQIGEGELVEISLANIDYQHWTKAADASPPCTPYAGIDDSARSQREKLRTQCLRRLIARRREAIVISIRVSQIVKLGAEIGQIVEVFGLVCFVPFRFLKPQPTMIGDFDVRCLQLKRCIPSAAVG